MKKRLLICAMALLMGACSKQAEQVQLPVKSVKVMKIDSATHASTRSISGTVQSANKSDVSFRVSGLIEAMNVQVGDKVKLGETLATLGKKEFDLDIQAAQAQLNSARASMAEKKDELVRQNTLLEKKYVAQSSVDQALVAFNQAVSNVEVAVSKLETAKNNLTYTKLNAPFSGTIAARNVEPFSEVAAGQTVYQLQTRNELEVDVLIPESMINSVNYGDVVSVVFPTFKDKTYSATISEIGSEAKSSNAYQVAVKLSQSDSTIRPGMTARVTFNLSPSGASSSGQEKGYLIPITALDTRLHEVANGESGKRISVFVVEEGKVVKRSVAVRDVSGNKLQVIDGLSPGDNLIVAGVSFLHEGQSVKIWQPTYNLPAVIHQ